MKLPNGDRADLGTKIEEYSLNFHHREGRHKARVFLSALGIALDGAAVLRCALKEAAASSRDVESRGDNGFGEVFVQRFPMSTAAGSAVVLSAWIVRHGEDFPVSQHVILYDAVNNEIRMHDLVALLEETPAQHFESAAPIILRRGQIGTVVMTYDGSAFEVEFADDQGRAFAILPIPSSKLIVLHDAPATAAA
jgi:hypothetical protein